MLDQAVAGLRAEVARFGEDGVVAGADVDPQIANLSRLFGAKDDKTTLTILTVLVALFVELGSGVGLYVTHAHLVTRQVAEGAEKKQHKQQARTSLRVSEDKPFSDAHWVQERVMFGGAAQIAATDLYQDYLNYCARHGRIDALDQTAFGEWLSSKGIGDRRKINGIWYYLGLRLNEQDNVVVPFRAGL